MAKEKNVKKSDNKTSTSTTRNSAAQLTEQEIFSLGGSKVSYVMRFNELPYYLSNSYYRL
jgi:hypothetical protein